MKAVLALDPGKTTGVAFCRIDDGGPFDFESHQFDFDDTCKYVNDTASGLLGDLVIVSESFIINANTVKNTQAPWSLELIGVSRYISRLYTGRDLFLQAPASAKRFSSDDRLRLLDWYKKGKGHANDAARHLLLLLASRGKLHGDILAQFALNP